MDQSQDSAVSWTRKQLIIVIIWTYRGRLTVRGHAGAQRAYSAGNRGLKKVLRRNDGRKSLALSHKQLPGFQKKAVSKQKGAISKARKTRHSRKKMIKSSIERSFGIAREMTQNANLINV